MVVELRLSFSDVIGLLIVLLALICTVTAADTTTLLLPSIKSKSPITGKINNLLILNSEEFRVMRNEFLQKLAVIRIHNNK